MCVALVHGKFIFIKFAIVTVLEVFMFDVKSKPQNVPSHKSQNNLKHKKNANSSVIQRLVYNEGQKTLFTNDSWKDKQYSDNHNVNKNILTKSGLVYHIDPNIEKNILHSYRIYQENIDVNFQATRRSFYDDIPINRNEKLKPQRRSYKKMRDDINKEIKDEYYLYKYYNWNAYKDNNVTREPVLPPEDLCDKLESSDVNIQWNDGLKSKVCVLIAIVKQMEASATHDGADEFSRCQSFIELLKSAVFPDTPLLQTKAHDYFTDKNSESLYKLIEILHNDVHTKDEYQAYDLDRINEKLYMDLGYNRIISCNCSFMDFGKNVPNEIVLKKDHTYIFIIEGHAMAVTMLQDLGYTQNAINPNLYFNPHNDAQNFSDDWTHKKVRQVLERNAS